MPAGKDGGKTDGGGGGSGATNAAGRTTFRPPWVKEGPNPLPVPAAPWTLKTVRRGSNNNDESAASNVQAPQLRKTSKITVNQAQENGGPVKDSFVRPQLKPVPPKDVAPNTKLQSKEVKVPIKLNSVKDTKKTPPSRTTDDPETIDKATPATRNALVRQESMRKLNTSGAPPPPVPPPAPALPKLIEAKPLTGKKAVIIEQLKSRPKTRPDWTAMLKEIEGQKKLKHVECNDRSKPLLPKAKEKGQFLYDSERSNVHNELLKQIQQGICLKKTRTNDRSKPMLEGLRKFRRQMTIEEQIIKSQSMASIPPEEIVADEADEMDDIDKVRDDLQSTKQMLALELRNKEAQIRENKRLQARIQNLEAELEKERNSDRKKTTPGAVNSEADEKLIKSLKTEAEQARKASEELEKKFHDTSEQLDGAKSELEEAKRQNQLLEKKLQEALQGRAQASANRKASVTAEDEETDYEMEESDSDNEGTEEEKAERRGQRELKVLRNKLRSYKNKQENAKKERLALKDQMKKTQTAIKEEKKKYKSLQKEVDKMAKLMKDTGEEDEDEEDEKEEEEEEESETESESSESESEGSESDDSESEKSQSEPEDAPVEKKKDNLTKRSKRHENILGALKKGNYMLKTNVERLEDDLNKQKELTQSLQADLDSVLAELG